VRAVSAWLESGLAASPATVLHISEPKASPLNLDPIRDWLAFHGIKAESETRERHFEAIGDVLLDQTTKKGAGILVMGGYEKSRYREAVFGGVTRHVIRNATIPDLLMH